MSSVGQKQPAAASPDDASVSDSSISPFSYSTKDKHNDACSVDSVRTGVIASHTKAGYGDDPDAVANGPGRQGDTKRTGSSIGAFLNIVTVVIGTGTLQLPYSIRQSGWAGLVLLPVATLIGLFTGNLVIKALYLTSGGRLRNFKDIGKAAYGRFGLYFTSFFNAVYISGIVCVYIILAGTNIGRIINDLSQNGGAHVPVAVRNSKFWMFISAVMMWLPFVAFKHLAETAVLAFFGFVTSIVVTVIAVVQCARFPDRGGGGAPGAQHSAPATHTDALLIKGFPMALGSIAFAYCGVAIYPHVEAGMRNPARWPTVLAVSMGVITVAYLAIAVTGYWAFGDHVKSPILDNLPNDGVRIAADILITLHVILAAPIMMTSLALEIETSFRITRQYMSRGREFVIRFALRTLLCACLLGISLAIPYFGDVLSLVGAFSTTVIFTIIPITCYIKLKGWRTIRWYTWVMSVGSIFVGLIGCILGSVSSIQALVRDINNDHRRHQHSN